MEKTELRQRMLRERQQMTHLQRSSADERIRRLVVDLLQDLRNEGFATRGFQRPAQLYPPVVGLFHPIRGEVDVFAARQELRHKGWTTALSKTDVANRALQFFRVEENTTLTPGVYGILERAKDAAAVAPKELAALVVPGLAFTPKGERIGYGGGFYDRFLSDPSVHAIRIGVAYALQLVPALPDEPHDEGMDYVVTELGVTKCALRP